jgi:hypothetical protein
VVESIKRASLKVNPNVRLSDNFYFCIFTHVVCCFGKNKTTTWRGKTSRECPSFYYFNRTAVLEYIWIQKI